MKLDAILNGLNERRDRVLKGELNCIPLPFKRFSTDFPGIEQAKYYLVSASSKVGKSKLTDFLFVYDPIFYMLENPGKLKLKIFYFTLEMSKKRKYHEFICHTLYRKTNGRIRVNQSDLTSTSPDRPLPKEVLELINSEEYRKIFQTYEDCVELISGIKNQYGIYLHCYNYAMAHGTPKYDEFDFTDPSTKIVTKKRMLVGYEPDDPDEYRIVIIDNAANLTTEKGKKPTETISDMSKNCITLRDDYGFTMVLVQHQQPSQESNENLKLNKLRPTMDGLGDCKSTARDVDIALGLFSPSRYNLPSCDGYAIPRFGDYIRFMEIFAGRDGGGGSTCPLFFDGAVASFSELPHSSDTKGLEEYYRYVASLEAVGGPKQGMFLASRNKSKYTQGTGVPKRKKKLYKWLKL